MKTLSTYDKLAIPDWSLSYLVNGDDSGITAEDKTLADGFMQQFDDEAKANDGRVIFSTENDDEGSFTHNPEFGLACNCVQGTVLIVR